ncbi:MAG: hypothetical protein DIZ80_07855 [endosymbiont of Galathealinum brachiosum]|uniref:non-specific serine/threonine protein kinase n=1 Tax=endosymbiont of Galathealinum brachiosum TaxID=2200906 RepID=A0A370DGJ6_9GAMM|nr:MAG: hypothetical protein DIZ80_07855 [endosymbiont of Galathealinum brachiosum]
MFLDSIIQIKQQIITRTQESIRLVPVVTRKPKVFRHWLLASHKPQIFIVALFILIPFAILPLMDLLLSQVFSPVTQDVLFGLFSSEEESPYLSGALIFSHWVIWVVAVSAAIYLYLRYIPVALEQAHEIASDKERQADNLISTNPSQSVLLYDAAQEWVVDIRAESALTTKIDSLNMKMRQFSSDEASSELSPDAAATIVLTENIAETEKALIADRYQVIKELGAGAMGTVYLADDTRLNRQVALKQLSPLLSADKQQLARFRQEALALARFSHPNIVQVYDFIEWNNLFLIAIELVDGGDLEEKLSATLPLALDKVIKLMLQMSEALAYAHEHGVIHRDLKPANILLSNKGDAKITDFGISKLVQSSVLTQVNTVMGSPAYMSPEQANGDDTDERTDIYSLGIVFYQMICGERPFQGDAQSIIAQHLTKIPPDLSVKCKKIPAGLNEMVHKMLEKKPQDRFQSIVEVIELLKKF